MTFDEFQNRLDPWLRENYNDALPAVSFNIVQVAQHHADISVTVAGRAISLHVTFYSEDMLDQTKVLISSAVQSLIENDNRRAKEK